MEYSRMTNQGLRNTLEFTEKTIEQNDEKIEELELRNDRFKVERALWSSRERQIILDQNLVLNQSFESEEDQIVFDSLHLEELKGYYYNRKKMIGSGVNRCNRRVNENRKNINAKKRENEKLQKIIDEISFLIKIRHQLK